MKVIIAGSRSISNYKTVCDAVRESGFVISEVVSGGAKGVDKLGERFAKEHNIPVKVFPADWKNIEVEGAVIKHNSYGSYNALAGHMRNQQMAEYADALIAVIENNSSGTLDMITRALNQGIGVHAVRL
jgi:predicted Rossmann-fold nucleotide-binding protein